MDPQATIIVVAVLWQSVAVAGPGVAGVVVAVMAVVVAAASP